MMEDPDSTDTDSLPDPSGSPIDADSPDNESLPGSPVHPKNKSKAVKKGHASFKRRPRGKKMIITVNDLSHRSFLSQSSVAVTGYKQKIRKLLQNNKALAKTLADSQVKVAELLQQVADYQQMLNNRTIVNMKLNTAVMNLNAMAKLFQETASTVMEAIAYSQSGSQVEDAVTGQSVSATLTSNALNIQDVDGFQSAPFEYEQRPYLLYNEARPNEMSMIAETSVLDDDDNDYVAMPDTIEEVNLTDEAEGLTPATSIAEDFNKENFVEESVSKTRKSCRRSSRHKLSIPNDNQKTPETPTPPPLLSLNKKLKSHIPKPVKMKAEIKTATGTSPTANKDLMDESTDKEKDDSKDNGCSAKFNLSKKYKTARVSASSNKLVTFDDCSNDLQGTSKSQATAICSEDTEVPEKQIATPGKRNRKKSRKPSSWQIQQFAKGDKNVGTQSDNCADKATNQVNLSTSEERKQLRIETLLQNNTEGDDVNSEVHLEGISCKQVVADNFEVVKNIAAVKNLSESEFTKQQQRTEKNQGKTENNQRRVSKRLSIASAKTTSDNRVNGELNKDSHSDILPAASKSVAIQLQDACRFKTTSKEGTGKGKEENKKAKRKTFVISAEGTGKGKEENKKAKRKTFVISAAISQDDCTENKNVGSGNDPPILNATVTNCKDMELTDVTNLCSAISQDDCTENKNVGSGNDPPILNVTVTNCEDMELTDVVHCPAIDFVVPKHLFLGKLNDNASDDAKIMNMNVNSSILDPNEVRAENSLIEEITMETLNVLSKNEGLNKPFTSNSNLVEETLTLHDDKSSGYSFDDFNVAKVESPLTTPVACSSKEVQPSRFSRTSRAKSYVKFTEMCDSDDSDSDFDPNFMQPKRDKISAFDAKERKIKKKSKIVVDSICNPANEVTGKTSQKVDAQACYRNVGEHAAESTADNETKGKSNVYDLVIESDESFEIKRNKNGKKFKKKKGKPNQNKENKGKLLQDGKVNGKQQINCEGNKKKGKPKQKGDKLGKPKEDEGKKEKQPKSGERCKEAEQPQLCEEDRNRKKQSNEDKEEEKLPSKEVKTGEKAKKGEEKTREKAKQSEGGRKGEKPKHDEKEGEEQKPTQPCEEDRNRKEQSEEDKKAKLPSEEGKNIEKPKKGEDKTREKEKQIEEDRKREKPKQDEEGEKQKPIQPCKEDRNRKKQSDKEEKLPSEEGKNREKHKKVEDKTNEKVKQSEEEMSKQGEEEGEKLMPNEEDKKQERPRQVEGDKKKETSKQGEESKKTVKPKQGAGGRRSTVKRKINTIENDLEIDKENVIAKVNETGSYVTKRKGKSSNGEIEDLAEQIMLDIEKANLRLVSPMRDSNKDLCNDEQRGGNKLNGVLKSQENVIPHKKLLMAAMENRRSKAAVFGHDNTTEKADLSVVSSGTCSARSSLEEGRGRRRPLVCYKEPHGNKKMRRP